MIDSDHLRAENHAFKKAAHEVKQRDMHFVGFGFCGLLLFVVLYSLGSGIYEWSVTVPEIPVRWRGEYDSPTAWQREKGRRVRVSVAGQFIKVQETYDDKILPWKFLKVESSADYTDYALVNLKGGNTAELRNLPNVSGFYEFEFTDISFVGEKPNGQEVYEDYGLKPVPLEKSR